MTAPARWQPSAAVRARGEALQGRIPYGRGSRLERDGETTQRTPLAATQELAAWAARWPGVRSVGTRRSPAKPSTAGRERDLHEDGRGADAMIAAPATPAGDAAGDALAGLLISHADRLGVQLVIWRGTEWASSRVGAAWEDYTGPEFHRDHVHVELSPEVATWPAGTMRARLAELAASSSSSSSGGGLSGKVLLFFAALAVLLARGGRS